MATNMLTVLPCSKLFTTRNACLLCTRSFSTEIPEVASDTSVPNSSHDTDIEFNKDAKAARLKRHTRRRKLQTFRGVDPFWIQEDVPLWRSAFSKLLIKEPNIEVPKVMYRGVELPRKVKRDPLTVLKALSETMKVENPGVNYNFVDDPRLQQTVQKDSLLHAKMEGKRTANKMMAMYKKAFVAYKADPDIPDFNPVTNQYEDTSLSVSALEERIKKRRVVDASEIYERLSEKGEEVPLEVEERLLELVCVFNGEDPKEPETVRVFTMEKPELPKWKGELAELIFEKHVESGTVTPFMYNVYVCGILQHTWLGREGEVDVMKAVNLYKEMKKNDITVFLCTYNQLMNRGKVINTKEIMRDMKADGLVPTKETLDNALRDRSRLHIVQVLAEKKLAGIDLGFYDMYQIFRRNPKDLEFLEEMVDYMAAQTSWYLDHPGENILLSMMKYLNKLDDPGVLPVARKLYQLKKDLGTRFKPTIFNSERGVFTHYFDIMMNHAPFEELVQVYKQLVPYYIGSGPFVKRIIEKTKKENMQADILIDLFHDTFNFVPQKAIILEKILQNLNLILVDMLDDRHTPELRKQFAELAATFFKEFIEEEQNTRFKDIQDTVIGSRAAKTSLEVMLNEPTYLEKAWEGYMIHGERSIQMFNKQDLQWKKMIEKLIEANDVLKIRQFLNKIKSSSTWVDHKFLVDMKEPLLSVLGAEEREILEHVLSQIK